jgi:hypothetical protein
MPVNQSAVSEVVAVRRIHESVSNFGAFIQLVRDNTAGNVASALLIPARVTGLLADKARFDSLGLSVSRISGLMEKDLGYTAFATDIADFNAVFAKAPDLRTDVLNNVNQFTPVYNGDTLEWTTTAGIQTALNTRLDSILTHYA